MNNKKHIIFFILIILIFISSCSAPVRWGRKSEYDEKMIKQKGKIKSGKDKTEVRYLVTYNELTSNDMIIYFHGIGRSEYEWVEENGFGKVYYNIINNNKELKELPVVSISLGSAYFFIENAPAPYNTDLETLFINEIIPYFQEMLNINGKVFLMGHSMGGFNAITLGIRNPHKFDAILAISPYTAPVSPFSEEFEKKGEELKMPELQVAILKKALTNGFKTEENWNEYNPFYIIKNSAGIDYPYIILSRATNDLPGFNESINDFSKLLSEKGIDHYQCEVKGGHKSVCENSIYTFISKITTTAK